MDRKEFLSLLGVSSVSILAATCLGACKKSSTTDYSGPSNVDFTLDLTLPANAALLNAGGYLYSSGVIVAKTAAGAYIAVSQACPHEGVTVKYVSQSNNFLCPSHSATFAESGTVTGGPTSTSLKKYNTTLTGTSLRVYS